MAGLGLSLRGLGDTLALAALGERLGLVALGERLWMGDWLLLATGLQPGRCTAKPYRDIYVPWNLTHQAMTRNGTGRFAGISMERSFCLWQSERGKAPPPHSHGTILPSGAWNSIKCSEMNQPGS